MTEQMLADTIVDNLTISEFKVIAVSCPCPSDEIEDSYKISVGKMNERRESKDKRLFGFDVTGLDPTIRNITLLSITLSNSDYIRILIHANWRNWYIRGLYGINEDEVIMHTMLKIGYLKGFISILSRAVNHRFTYTEEFINELTYIFIKRNCCSGLANVLYADWVKLYEDYKPDADNIWLYHPLSHIDIEHLRFIQKQHFDEYVDKSIELNQPEITAILLRWKNEVLDDNNDEEAMLL